MKNVFYLSIVVAGILLLNSCNKDKVPPQGKSSYKRIDQTLDRIISNAQSDDDKRVRMVKHIFGEAMAELFRNQDYARMVIEDTKKSPLRNADFNRLRNANPVLKSELDNLLRKHLAKSGFFANKAEEDEPYIFLVSQLNYDEQYEAKIVIPNLDVMDVSKQPITSSGLDLEDDEFEDHDEAIWAKEYEPYSQEFIDIILKEQEALGETKPIFIFANGENEDKYIGKQVFGERTHVEISYKTEATNSTKRFDHQDMSVKAQSYFYDGSGRNEYCYTGVYYTSSGIWGWITLQNSNDLSKRVTRYRKSECNGQQRTVWGEVYYADTHYPAPTDAHVVFFNTFERDWYASAKNTGQYTYNGQTAYLVGKRAYTSEWYLSESGVVLNGANVPMWQYIDLQSNKSKFQITRVQ